jgi:hypothetical protein
MALHIGLVHIGLVNITPFLVSRRSLYSHFNPPNLQLLFTTQSHSCVLLQRRAQHRMCTDNIFGLVQVSSFLYNCVLLVLVLLLLRLHLRRRQLMFSAWFYSSI